MAVSSTTATVYVSRQILPTPTRKNGKVFLSSFRLASRPCRFVIRCSGDVSAESAAAAEIEESESSIEISEGPPSLISTLNAERAIRGLPITDVDHYSTLGLQRGCSYEQVTVAYQGKVQELLNQGLDQEELSKRMELLKESYSILSSNEERRMYDWSLARSDNPDMYKWPYEVDTLEAPAEPPPEIMEPEDEGPTRLVGYFFLAWILLSFVLAVVLK